MSIESLYKKLVIRKEVLKDHYERYNTMRITPYVQGKEMQINLMSCRHGFSLTLFKE